MSIYNHILLAVDLSEASHQLVEKVRIIAQSCQSDLSLIHVIEPLSFAYGGDVPMDLTAIQEQLDEHAQEKIRKFSAALDYPIKHQHIVSGHTESEIHRIAEETNCDLIVVGSHGRQGLALLLGSTANGVLHGANCDVLAIRLTEEE
ncbi:universal stress protein [Aliamphritea spongicola]|uniref:universal stress protein n=1 Tax=Aliamphritea spongicola TaxID=707589 RepID=UPI00196B61D0|nr:universal stress protein [Aliamphritea spongicola]MBN3560558.1 universal stress protein [Aliamphritea spongicola]